jgi:uncharacterized protein YbbC (DUF1343 family)/CubicO group peptidase (beta-lactamase class C family)
MIRGLMKYLWVCVWMSQSLQLVQAAPVIPPRLAEVFDAERLAEMDRMVEETIAQKGCPGGVIWVEREGRSYTKALGRRAVDPTAEPMTLDTIFDAASLTKVVATAPCVLLLVERGQAELDAPVSRYLPAFTGFQRERITVRHLLTHTSGLKPGLSRQVPWKGYEHGVGLALAEMPETAPGTQFRYSDINFILLGEMVRILSGTSLDKFAERELFGPLRMRDTGFLPAASLRRRIAPTQRVEGQMLRGVVHDPTSRAMGGVTGHAGLFTTAADLARFARLFLHEGVVDGRRILKAETVRLMTSVQSADGVLARRGLGWDIDSGYSRPRGRVFPLGSYGHTGFTGTCLWIDPFSKTFWLFLSNRVHPDAKGNILPLQLELGTLAAQAVRNFSFDRVPGALAARTNFLAAAVGAASVEVLNGIDVLVRDGFKPLRGLRVGLISNHTGQDRNRRSTIDLLHQAPEVSLKALFSPEHGIRGVADEKVSDSRDEATGLPVYSLYGDRRAPSEDQLKGLDALVFDIQDIGCRYYTYIGTMGNCMEAASKAGIRFVVLDRVNPINGVAVEGPVHTNQSTFVAYHELPLRHGMTVGELATLFRAERGWKLDLAVIRVEGWKRSMWFDETGLPWINPSPNMRSMAGAALYPGLGFHEAALAVGRGTDAPFQIIGAPYVNDRVLAAELRKENLPGVRFMPLRFQPTYSTFKDQPCSGVAITIVDRDRFSPVDVGLAIARTVQRLHPTEYALGKLRFLLTDEPTLEGIKAGRSVAEMRSAWTEGLARFKARRARFLLYPESPTP